MLLLTIATIMALSECNSQFISSVGAMEEKKKKRLPGRRPFNDALLFSFDSHLLIV